MNKLGTKIWYFITQYIYKLRFNHIGNRSVIVKPLQLDEVESIVIEDDVYVAAQAWLMGDRKKEETLRIGQGTTVGHYAHIIAKNRIHIGKNVLIADKVFLTDCTHRYEDFTRPIKKQEIQVIGSVCIGDGTWIGENVCVLGHSIGKHCVIGANSVVNKDIPDYSVAVGNPVRVIKSYDETSSIWRKLEND